MNEQEFINELEKINIILTEEQKEKLKIYQEFLLEYNEHTNLTAIKTKEEVYLKHFYDSITIVKIIDLNNQSLLDVGTGAGFPGLVLKIIFPDLKVTLLDSNNKKTTFLKKCIEKLKLKDIFVVNIRAEEFTSQKRETFDIVTSRAVAELRILLELNIPALKVGGYFIGMKGNIEEELKNAKNTIEKLYSNILEIKEFNLPKNAGFRTLIKIVKEKETEKKYPRPYDKIKKKSL